MARTYSTNKTKSPHTWLEFEDEGLSRSGKTRIWTVHSRSDVYELGIIKWYGRWRGYAFFVDSGMIILEQKCMRELADFLEEQTKLTRQGWRKKK